MQFAYHRSLGPMIGMLLGIAIVETLVVHLVVVALFGSTAAIVVGVLDVSMAIALAWLLRSFRRLPVTIADGVLTMRAGALRSVAVPLGQVAGLRPNWDAAALNEHGVLNLALASWPNVVIDLRAPVSTGHRRPVRAIAHRLDDPAGFAAAIEALGRQA